MLAETPTRNDFMFYTSEEMYQNTALMTTEFIMFSGRKDKFIHHKAELKVIKIHKQESCDNNGAIDMNMWS